MENPGAYPADDLKTPMRSNPQSHDQRERRFSLYLLLLFLVLTAGIVTAGYLIYRNYERNFRAGVERELSSIAELKVGQLVQWRKERLADASVFYRNRAFSGLVERLLETPADTDVRGWILSWLDRVQDASQYDRAFILDAQGIERLAVPETPEPVASHLLQQIPEILRSNKITFLDFHRDTPDRPIHLGIVVPIREEPDGGRPLGVLVLHIDPAVHLYPFIRQWPTPSRTAEALLVRREGDEALFLNDLRFRKNSALSLRVPLNKGDAPAAKAALGQEGVVEGIDYRGVPVLADMRGIPDSPWFLVACMDTTEVNAPLQERSWMIIGFVAVLLFGAGAGLGLIWRQQRLRFFRERLAAAEALEASENKFRNLFDNAVEGVYQTTPEGRLIAVNMAFARMFGYESPEEAIKTVTDIARQMYVDPDARKMAVSILRETGFLKDFEVQMRKKDGSTIWTSINARLNKSSDGNPNFEGFVTDITQRKRAEEALQLSYERFLLANRATYNAIWDWDLQANALWWNENFQTLFGYGAEEIELGIESWTNRIHPEDLERVRTGIHKAIDSGGHSWSDQYRFRRKDGGYAVVDDRGYIARKADGSPVHMIGAMRDITERKRAEDILRHEHMMLARTEGIAQIGSWEWAVATDTVTWSDELFRIFQRDPREGAPSFAEHPAFYHPDDMARLRQAVEAAVAKGTPYELELRAIRKDGGTRVCVARGVAEMAPGGRAAHLFGSLQDITERKRAEEALRQVEENYRHSLDESPLGVRIVTAEGETIYANRAILDIYGFRSLEELRTTPVEKRYTAESYTEFKKRYERRQQDEDSPSEYDVSIVRKNGEVRHLLVSRKELLWSGKKQYQTIYRDITERKQAEEELRASLREKEVLLREVHHRVKNNMQVISSLFNLQAGHTTNKECRAILKEGQTRIRSMSLVHEKLYQSRDLSKIDLAGYIRSLAAHLFHVYLVNPAQVRMEMDLEDVSLDINSAVPCGLILNELVSNALKHAFPEGRTGVIKIGLRRGPGGAVELRVADNGVGLPKGLDFRKAESFGLQIVNLLVDQLEAAIDLDRTKGTAFNMTFHELKYAPRA